METSWFHIRRWTKKNKKVCLVWAENRAVKVLCKPTPQAGVCSWSTHRSNPRLPLEWPQTLSQCWKKGSRPSYIGLLFTHFPCSNCTKDASTSCPKTERPFSCLIYADKHGYDIRGSLVGVRFVSGGEYSWTRASFSRVYPQEPMCNWLESGQRYISFLYKAFPIQTRIEGLLKVILPRFLYLGREEPRNSAAMMATIVRRKSSIVILNTEN